MGKDFETFGNPARSSIVAAVAEPDLFAALAPNGAMPKAAGGVKNGPAVERLVPLQRLPDLDALMAQTTPDELAVQWDKINEFYAALLV